MLMNDLRLRRLSITYKIVLRRIFAIITPMKRILLIILSTFTAILYAKTAVIVSIPPQAETVRAIGGEHVDVTVMVPQGSSPHTYEPKPSQMKAVARARLYLGIGVAFEKQWRDRFLELNPDLRFVDTTRNVPRRIMHTKDKDSDKMKHEEETHKMHAHTHGSYDPHVWTSPKNLILIAQNVYEALSETDPEHRAYYRKRLRSYTETLRRLDKEIETLLEPLRRRHTSVLSVHPSWGYFCDRYGLKQIPLEIEGKSITPKRLTRLIKTAKKERVAAILTQPEFSDKSAKLLADTLRLPLIRISPLSPDWIDTLKRLAHALSEGKR